MSYTVVTYTGALCCIVKLPDKECVSHTKCVEIKNYTTTVCRVLLTS